MVGVPGRSRGCVTCKKRRIACDVQGPPCGQCIRSKRACSFPQRHIFILNETNSHKTIYKKQAVFAETKACEKQELKKRTSATPKPSLFDSELEKLPTEVISRPFGTLSTLKQLLLANACAGNPVVTHEPYRGRPWTLAITAFGDSAHALNSAPLACYASWAGRRDKDPYLVEASQRLYVQGLREVQQAVNEPGTALRDETFGACLALIIYEALECPDRSYRGYNVHVEGCSRLVKLRGASIHQDGISHNLFKAFRYIDIIRAFELHRSTYLSSKAWTALPWRLHEKTHWDSLIDLLAEGPAILEKSDQLSKLPPHELLPNVIEIIEELLALDNSMQTYLSCLTNIYSGPLYWELPSLVTPLDLSDDWLQTVHAANSTIIHFLDIEIARTLTLYWSMLAMIYSGLNDLWGAMQSFLSDEILKVKFEQIYLSLAFGTKDWREPARKVCQSVQYCNDNAEISQGVGNVVIAVPLDIVLGVMKNKTGCDAEYREAKRARQEISRNWLRLLQFAPEQT